MALMVVGFTCCAVLSPRSPSAREQLGRLWRPLAAGVFTGLGLWAEFFQAVAYNSLDVLQRCLRDGCKPVGDFLGVFFLVEFVGGVSLASLLYWCSDIKRYPYRYIVCSNCLYILWSAELQLVCKHFLYKYKVDCTFLDSSFLGGFASQSSQGKTSRFQLIKQVGRLYFNCGLLLSPCCIVCVEVPQDYYLAFCCVDSLSKQLLYGDLGLIVAWVVDVDYTNLTPVSSQLQFIYIRADIMVTLYLCVNVLADQEVCTGSRVWFI